jgi:hypothetical protein
VTEAEKAFRFFSAASQEAAEPGYWEQNDLEHVDEKHVFQVAARWSVDPSQLETMDLAPALGLLGTPGESYPPKPKPIVRNPVPARKQGLLGRLFGK